MGLHSRVYFLTNFPVYEFLYSRAFIYFCQFTQNIFLFLASNIIHKIIASVYLYVLSFKMSFNLKYTVCDYECRMPKKFLQNNPKHKNKKWSRLQYGIFLTHCVLIYALWSHLILPSDRALTFADIFFDSCCCS